MDFLAIKNFYEAEKKVLPQYQGLRSNNRLSRMEKEHDTENNVELKKP